MFMFKIKKAVDDYAETELPKSLTLAKRLSRSFTIAKLYFELNEFASAERYLISYLSFKEDNDQVHKLLGQCYQCMQTPEKALKSFQRSLQLNPKQSDLLVKVYQLQLETEMSFHFKLRETCKQVLEAIQNGQAKMTSDGKEANSKANEKNNDAVESVPTKGFGDAFKPKAIDSPILAGDESTQNYFALSKKELSFTLKPKSPGKSRKRSAVGDGYHEEEKETNTYFTPTKNKLCIMELPALTLNKSSNNRTLLKQARIKSETTERNENIFSGFGGANSTASPTAIAASATEKPINTTFSFAATLNNSSKPSGETKLFGTGISGEFLFGSATSTAMAGGSIFGGAKDNKSTFGRKSDFDSSENAGNNTASIDFASLAKANANTNLTPKSNEKSGFIDLTNKNDFSSFGKFLKELDRESQKSADGDGVDAGDNNDKNYDPPIVELPKDIVVSTGEEEETKIFAEEAVLYRWDVTNNEWKERGVGELKLLFHPVKQSYRLVMRREQIHKLVLNHAINADFRFNNMNNNPKSFVWATMNYAESDEGELEKLAVRFKKVELAEAFSKELKECIDKCKKGEK